LGLLSRRPVAGCSYGLSEGGLRKPFLFRLGGLQGGVDLASDVALEAADDLGLAQSLLGPPVGVSTGSGVVAQAAQDDGVESVVGGAVEAVTIGPPAASRDRGVAA